MLYSGQVGRYSSGEAIGILTLESSPVAFIPGDVNNATTYPFPVRYQNVPGYTVEKAISGDISIYDNLLTAAKSLQQQGVKAITGGCGFMGLHQPRLAKEIEIPVFLSSLMQIPFISATIGSGKKIGVITANAENLSENLLKSVGVSDSSNLRIIGLENSPNFTQFAIEESGRLDEDAVREEILKTSEILVESDKSISAILLECSLLPPYSSSVQEMIDLPVFDYITMIKFIFSAVVQIPYKGFI